MSSGSEAVYDSENKGFPPLAIMEPLPANPEPLTAPSDAYLWEPVGKGLSIQLQLQVVDRLSIEVMRGFGAVPKRGAEVGGLLLGSIEEEAGRYVVRVEDFEPVAIEYARGPSYLMSVNDRFQLREALDRWQPGQHSSWYVVGFYRSHTRDGLTLTDEDLRLLDEYFADPLQVVLLVKPFATKVSIAGFVFREQGQFRNLTPVQEFPFRRRELGGGLAPPPNALPEVKKIVRVLPEEEQDLNDALANVPEVAERPGRSVPLFSGIEEPDSGAAGRSWLTGVLLPLLTVVTLLGAGYFLYEHREEFSFGAPVRDPYTIQLSAASGPKGFTVQWDPEAKPVHSARRGALIIEDGKSTQRVDLTPAQLRSGAVLYKQQSSSIAFRLELSLSEHATFSEEITVGSFTPPPPITVDPPPPAPVEHRRRRRTPDE